MLLWKSCKINLDKIETIFTREHILHEQQREEEKSNVVARKFNNSSIYFSYILSISVCVHVHDLKDQDRLRNENSNK